MRGAAYSENGNSDLREMLAWVTYTRHSSDRCASNFLTADDCLMIVCFVEVLIEAQYVPAMMKRAVHTQTAYHRQTCEVQQTMDHSEELGRVF
jgi:hypothetical protein